MKRSFVIAATLALGAIAWIGSGQLGGADRPKENDKPPADLAASEVIPSVRVRVQNAELRTAKIALHGKTEAERKVNIKSETYGRIVELNAEKGETVATGSVLARLAADERPARLAEAKSLREQRRIEYEASKRLNKKGYRAETQVAGAKAALDAAVAAVKTAQMGLDHMAILAPFDGLIVDRNVEIGDFVETGDPIARLIDLDPLLIVVHVNERDAGRLTLGALATARLITGQTVEGLVSYVSAEADDATRTFRVEVEVANVDGLMPDGVSAEVSLPLQQIVAHRLSPAVLALDDSGQIGVKTLTPDNTVTFMPVQVMDEEPTGVWVAGLPQRVVLITVGQEFISDGQKVLPIDDATLKPFGWVDSDANTASVPRDDAS